MFERRLAVVSLIFLATIGVAGSSSGKEPPADCPLHDSKAATPPAPKSPYVGQEARSIKALSADQRQQLLAGHGMGLALAAELNHYPGPKHVLELAPMLNLTDEQIRETRTIFHEMQARAQALGREIVDAEAALDARFASATIDQTALSDAVRGIGRLQAELRVAHLRAHLQMRVELTAEQSARYDELRGYVSSRPSVASPGGP